MLTDCPLSEQAGHRSGVRLTSASLDESRSIRVRGLPHIHHEGSTLTTPVSYVTNNEKTAADLVSKQAKKAWQSSASTTKLACLLRASPESARLDSALHNHARAKAHLAVVKRRKLTGREALIALSEFDFRPIAVGVQGHGGLVTLGAVAHLDLQV